MSEAPGEMVVDHARRLKVGVHDRRSNELESPGLHVFRDAIGELRARGQVAQSAKAVVDRLSIGESPDVAVERPELLPDFQESPRIAHGGIDLQPVPDDAGVAEEGIDLSPVKL